MTRDDIIKLALMGERSLKQRIEWAVDMEREECAKVCESVGEHPSLTPRHCAEAIRARGQNVIKVIF